MKKYILVSIYTMRLRIIQFYFALLFVLLPAGSVLGQTEDSKFVAGLSAIFLNYQDPIDGKYFQTFDPGISFGAHAYLNRFMNLSINSAFVPEVKNYPLGDGEFLNTSLIDVSALVQFKANNDIIFAQNSFFAPYISTGFGVNTASNNARVYIPAVLGMRFRINDNFSFNVDGAYKLGIDGKDQHMAFSAGFVFGLPTNQKPENIIAENKPTRKVKPANKEKVDPNSDRDGDGVIDIDDKCPDVAGYVTYFGCPEGELKTDDKKISDSNQQPEVPISEPVTPMNTPDIKKVETLPEEPNTKVFASTEPSQEDIDFLENAMDMVHFEPASDKLTQDSYAVLDKVAEIMNKYPDHKLKVSGYTDNRGDTKANKLLSITRAFNVKRYLVYDKDIRLARIVSDGYSSAKPIASNSTASGRKKNRRVEFELLR